MKQDKMPPIPGAGETAEDALALLAGAVLANLDIALFSNPNRVAEVWEYGLFVAITQWRNSGFALDEAEEVRKGIVEDWAEVFRLSKGE